MAAPLPLTVSLPAGDFDAERIAVVVIGGVPQDAVLSAGVDNGDGSWMLSPLDLTGLALTAPTACTEEVVLTVTAFVVENREGELAAVSDTIRLPFEGSAPIAQAIDPAHPPLERSARSEPAIGPADPPFERSAPSGLAVDPADLPSERSARSEPVTGPADLPFEGSVPSGLVEGSAPSGQAINLADLPLEGSAPSGLVEQSAPSGPAIDPADLAVERSAPIALAIDPAVLQAGGAGLNALVIRDLPEGARLSAGTYDPAIDGWVLRPRQLEGLTLTPPAGQAGFTLTVLGISLGAGEAGEAKVLTRLPIAAR